VEYVCFSKNSSFYFYIYEYIEICYGNFRLLMNRTFVDFGMFHFTSNSMIDKRNQGSSTSLVEIDDLRISSVIVDEHRGILQLIKSDNT